MSHIFISYSRKDLHFAQKIVDALAANDLDTWIDWKSIPKGERRLSVADEIEKELDATLPCGDDMVRAERLQGAVLNIALQSLIIFAVILLNLPIYKETLEMNENKFNAQLDEFVTTSRIDISDQARALLHLCIDAIESDPHPAWLGDQDFSQFSDEMSLRLPSFLYEIWHNRRLYSNYNTITTYEVLHWLGDNLTKICPIQKKEENVG